jgi:hypothetical protein
MSASAKDFVSRLQRVLKIDACPVPSMTWDQLADEIQPRFLDARIGPATRIEAILIFLVFHQVAVAENPKIDIEALTPDKSFTPDTRERLRQKLIAAFGKYIGQIVYLYRLEVPIEDYNIKKILRGLNSREMIGNVTADIKQLRKAFEKKEEAIQRTLGSDLSLLLTDAVNLMEVCKGRLLVNAVTEEDMQLIYAAGRAWTGTRLVVLDFII